MKAKEPNYRLEKIKYQIIEAITDYCNDNLDEWETTIKAEDLEVYDENKDIILTFNFVADVEVLSRSRSGTYFDHPESGEYKITLSSTHIVDFVNANGIERTNCKNALQELLDKCDGILI